MKCGESLDPHQQIMIATRPDGVQTDAGSTGANGANLPIERGKLRRSFQNEDANSCIWDRPWACSDEAERIDAGRTPLGTAVQMMGQLASGIAARLEVDC